MKARLAVIAVAALVLIAGLAINPAPHSPPGSWLGRHRRNSAGRTRCLLMTSYLVRRVWTEALHGIMVSATSVLPVLGVLLLPVLIGVKQLYPGLNQVMHCLCSRRSISRHGSSCYEAVIYFAVLSGLALWQRAAWGNPERMMRSASIGLIVWALVVSLAGIDWVELLNLKFHSSVYGLLYLCFTLLDGAAFAILVGLASGRRIGATKGYSALLLSVLLLWTYFMPCSTS